MAGTYDGTKPKVRKGGVNPPPTTLKPNVVPPPQKQGKKQTVHTSQGTEIKCAKCGFTLGKNSLAFGGRPGPLCLECWTDQFGWRSATCETCHYQDNSVCKQKPPIALPIVLQRKMDEGIYSADLYPKVATFYSDGMKLWNSACAHYRKRDNL